MNEIVKGYVRSRIDYDANVRYETLYAKRVNGEILVTEERVASVVWPTKNATWVDSGLDHEGLKQIAEFIGNYKIEV